MIEYPKSLYLFGWDDLSATVVVNDPEEEAAAREGGYRMLSEPEPVEDDGETPAKRGPGRPRKQAD